MFFTTLLLAQTVFVKTPDGNVYKAVNDVPVGQCILTGEEELVFEASNFNTCNEVVLQPGCYRAEMRGGIGTANENCLDHIGFDDNTTISAVFSISQPTTVYALRGGDGNPGKTIISNGCISSFGGGASGVDSILVIGDRVWRANGGPGKTCTRPKQDCARNLVATSTTVLVGNGFGGGVNLPDHINGARSFLQHKPDAVIYSIGGGGGGAPSGVGGANWQYKYTYPTDGIVINPGENGTSLSGGDGGNVTSCKTYACTELVTVNGGRGGATMPYICGGQYAYSYGGGGGGAAVIARSSTTTSVGGDGGSGSTGTSNVSFVRIYKM